MSAEQSVTLRAPQESDIGERQAFGYSAEIVRMFGGDSFDAPPVMSYDKAAAWHQRISEHPHAWVIALDSACIGEAFLNQVHLGDKRARMALGLFSERHLGQGIGRMAIKAILAHAFDEMDLHRVDLRVLSYNERAIRCYRACGFVHEGTERESAFVDGQWHDDWIMGILRSEFDLLRNRNLRSGR